MTTITDIITRGFREAGIVAVGDTPDADEVAEGLTMLQGLYSSFFGNELGEPLPSVNYGIGGLTNAFAIDEDRQSSIDDIYVPTNIRLILNLDSAAEIFLSPNPMDGARFAIIDNAGNLASKGITINGNGRQIESSASVNIATNSVNREWFYRADLGNWARVSDLVGADPSPLPREFDDLLSTALAIRINPRYGAETSTELIDVLKRMRRQFRARYSQTIEQEVEPGLFRLTGNKYSKYVPY